MQNKIDIMKDKLLTKLPKEGVLNSTLKGVELFRIDDPFKKRPQLYNPQIIILAQGKKNIYLGDNTYFYDRDHYYVQTVPLSVECEAIIEKDKPMVGLTITIDPQIIGEILFDMDIKPPKTSTILNSLYDAPTSDSVIDAAIRLIDVIGNKNETRVLGPLYVKEIIFKILSGENGEILRELAVNNRGFYQISRIINNIHENYSKPFEVQELASEAGMSATAFHSAFRAITSTSPLQYIKNIRLYKAKEMIQTEGEKANVAAIRVGYESPSQFSREYKRFFGTTPAKDKNNVALYAQ
ncbi:MAG: AraC family transcriptional regulator [Pleomorphochaeta sp.]